MKRLRSSRGRWVYQDGNRVWQHTLHWDGCHHALGYLLFYEAQDLHDMRDNPFQVRSAHRGKDHYQWRGCKVCGTDRQPDMVRAQVEWELTNHLERLQEQQHMYLASMALRDRDTAVAQAEREYVRWLVEANRLAVQAVRRQALIDWAQANKFEQTLIERLEAHKEAS